MPSASKCLLGVAALTAGLVSGQVSEIVDLVGFASRCGLERHHCGCVVLLCARKRGRRRARRFGSRALKDLVDFRRTPPPPPSTLQVPVTLRWGGAGDEAVYLSNGYTSLRWDLMRGALDRVQGRFEGDGVFAGSPNVAPAMRGAATAAGVHVGALAVVVSGNGRPESYAETATSAFTRAAPLQWQVAANTTAYAAFTVTGVTDGAQGRPAPRITCDFTFSLAATDRWFAVNVSVQPLAPFNTSMVRMSTAWAPLSSLAMYQKGVRQGMLMPASYLASVDPWRRWMGVGPVAAGAVEMRPATAATSTAPTILFAGNVNGRGSGLDVVLAGLPPLGGWMDGVEGAPVFLASQSYAAAVTIAPSNYDFALHGLPAASSAMAADDIRSILTPIYSSTLAASHSYDFAPEGRLAPCLTINGGNCYSGTWGYFDPDSALSVFAMMWSYDPDVWEEVRRIVETNGAFLCHYPPLAKCAFGQLIHHFVDSCGSDDSCFCTASPFNPAMQDCATYAALSGATQTGPNIFWSLAALRYASVTGNMTWLAARMPDLRFSMTFLLQRFDASVGLFNAPGPLWIDTFIRTNYTSDTNAAMVWLLREFADAEAALGNSTGAAYYLTLATTVLQAMPRYLWHPVQQDHFCTNSNPGPTPGSVVVCARDYVDYDSNLLAVAVGAATGAQAAAVLARVDGGACTHSRGTWVSEIFYDAANCNDGNTGDSLVRGGAEDKWGGGVVVVGMPVCLLQPPPLSPSPHARTCVQCRGRCPWAASRTRMR